MAYSKSARSSLLDIAHEVLNMDVGDLGLTQGQLHYLADAAREMAEKIVEAEKGKKHGLLITIPPHPYQPTHVHITFQGRWTYSRKSIRFNIKPPIGTVNLDIDNEDIEVEKYDPHPGFDEIGF